MDSDFIIRRGKMLLCEMCGTKLATDQCAADHIKGKKHRRLVNMKQSREEQSERSIFVGNIRKTTPEPELMGHFSKFGPVAKIIIDKQKSSYAILEFANKESAIKATQDEKQMMNGLHIVVRPREVREFVSSGIKQRDAALENRKKREEEMQKETEILILMLLEKENIATQVDSLMEVTRLSDSSLELRYLICSLLREVFSEFFPNCRVYPYGSSVNGCGRENSDLDIFLSLNWVDREWNYRFASLEGVTPAPSEAEGASQSPEDTSMEEGLPDPELASGKDALEFVANVLQKCVPSCHKVHLIPSARKPVIKFIHTDSGLHCDMILNNRLSLRNTELGDYYCSLSPLVQPLIFLVRRWGKVHHISENVGPGPRLTNYAVTWMVIFYLQTRGILPTVEVLKKEADPADKLMIDGWNCSLRMDKSPSAVEGESLKPEQILQGFFGYYSELDWSSKILCPATGRLNPVVDMTLVEHPSAQGTFKTGSMNIQDPLELTHNIAANVNEKTLKIITQAFTKAVTTCSSERFARKSDKAGSGPDMPPWGIALLVNSDPREHPVKKLTQSSVKFSLNVEMRKEQISDEFSDRFDNRPEMTAAWAARMETFLMDTLRDALKVSCTRIRGAEESKEGNIGGNENADSSMEVDDEMYEDSKDGSGVGNVSCGGDKPNAGEGPGSAVPPQEAKDPSQETQEPPQKKQRMGEADLVDMGVKSQGKNEVESDKMEGNVSTLYSCELFHEVWMGRRRVRRSLQKAGNDSQGLALERLVTEKLILELAGASKKGESVLEFHLDVRKDLKAPAVKLTMLPLKGEAPFKDFHHFLEAFLVKYADELKFQ